MTHIGCTPFLPVPQPGRVRWLTRRLAPVLAPALLVATLGCREEEATSPSAPESPPALDITPAQALSFRHVSVGSGHTCGVTLDNLVYCWGESNLWGQLGDGTTVAHEAPVAVAGGLRFRQVSAGVAHTCGVTTTNRAFCWGYNGDGRLGNGTATGPETCPLPCSTRPVAVAGGLQFRQVSVRSHSCGVTTDNRAYCWGPNGNGELGDGTTTQRLAPVAVTGGQRFLQVSAGASYTCAVNLFDRAFCWGRNSRSQLGDNTTTPRLTPTRVTGGLLFRQVIAGRLHTCGVTTGDLGYCWGSNNDGQLGDGTLHTRRRPVAVAGGLSFRHVVANSSQQVSGQGYSCGVTRANLAYCWGGNRYGRLGNGTVGGRSLTPSAVVGGHQFRQVSVGENVTCGVTTSDRAFCWGRLEESGEPAPVPVPDPT
jgi:alpha-tubulin suppressor-like RCC1 family protein